MGASSFSSLKKKKIRMSQQINTNVTPSFSSQEKSESNMYEGRSYHNTDSIYWLPNDNEELDRLIGQHFALKSLFGGNFNTKVLDYMSMEDRTTKVLDCGCGPGTWIMDVATEYPNIQLTGIDISDVFPTSIRPPNVNFCLGNLLERLPFEDNTFDFIHVRLFIAALRKEEWPLALEELFRVLKPGGILISTECSQIGPGRDFINEFAILIAKFMESRGQEPEIAAMLPDLLVSKGYELIDSVKQVINLGANDSLSREFLYDVINLTRNAKPFIAPHLNLTTDQEYNDMVNKLTIECQKEPQAQWSFTSTVARKPL
ncbi:S-adenosyl-L-methionine-dependent methyltransferase [Halteromyces radiatus]|uniref:S-adenosyl-L-methionine-dependent methyltransferase n=1 Tax=Halteromyces radiatus TaxID=101107 RepID=UPI00221F8922|nr:S-adenosyl-L-methionine-dependent methyltransferase [Halteromyces radiatus]KAI8082848.1 S-adenosyl-L-methionine-dependent methyltransferase [Halteromyces radiatus]